MTSDEQVVEVRLEQAVAGGAVLARPATGPVVLARDGLPGELVRVRIDRSAKRHLEGTVVEILEPSAVRRDPPCPHVAEGCGGCDLQHAATGAQVDLKRAVVLDALRRIGGLPEPDRLVTVGETLPATGYRTTVRGVVTDAGRFAFRGRRSHDAIGADGCLVAHPLVAELIDDGRFGDAAEVTLRVGARTGERLAIVDPMVGDVQLPDDVRVVGTDELAHGRRAWIHEVVNGRRFRVSARSFFQARADGADALVHAVSQQVGVANLPVGDGATVLDAYCGVGLFTAFLAAGGREVIGIEWNRSSVADAKVNLAGTSARVRPLDVAAWKPSPVDVVVADPSRDGLGRAAVDVVAATGAQTIVLVSCDAAALARDTALLGVAGYDLSAAVLIDLFPHTHHLEVVSRFTRR